MVVVVNNGIERKRVKRDRKERRGGEKRREKREGRREEEERERERPVTIRTNVRRFVA